MYSYDKPAAFPAVAAFTAANALGVPFVDRPVEVTVLARAALAGLRDENVEGIQDFKAMESLASRM